MSGGVQLAFVPLDDRPCTRGFPGALAALIGWTLREPPREALGWCTTPGDPEALLAWLEATLPGGPSLLSVDMLVYGGLVASRSLDLPAAVALQRADRLAAALRRAAVPPLAFNVVMRVPPYCTSDAERRFSERLLAWSQLAARTSLGLAGRLRRRHLERGLPVPFRERYLAARARNHEVNRRFLEWDLGFALLGMDDSRTEGFNVLERRALEPLAAAAGDRGALIPGADELAMLLLARLALDRAGCRPTLEVRYSPDGLRRRVTRYEDRAVADLVEAHRRVLGLELAATASADLVLYVHGPSGPQQEASLQLVALPPSRRLRTLASAVARDVERGRQVAVADLGYANGGDRALVQALSDACPLPDLAAYAAWNTAGNTVGTALAHATLRWLSLHAPDPALDAGAAAAAHVRFLLERFVDDWLYQAVIRQGVGARCAASGLNIYGLGERRASVRDQVCQGLVPAGEDFFHDRFAGREVRGPRGTHWRIGASAGLAADLPWPRIFEVALRSAPVLEAAG